MKNSVQGRGITFGKQRGTIHLPCKVLPSFNSVIKSQNLQPGRIRRLVASQPAKVTFPWGMNKTAGKAWRAEKEGLQPASVSHSRATLTGAEIQVWSGHTAGAARMAFPHSYQLFQAFSTWRWMFVWKKEVRLNFKSPVAFERLLTQPGKASKETAQLWRWGNSSFTLKTTHTNLF